MSSNRVESEFFSSLLMSGLTGRYEHCRRATSDLDVMFIAECDNYAAGLGTLGPRFSTSWLA